MRKTAWINEQDRIISFEQQDNADAYCEEATAFWEQILTLMQNGYRVR